MRITADDLRRRADSIRRQVPEDAKEARLRETSAALLERAAATQDAGAALSLVLQAGETLERARGRWRDLHQPIGLDWTKSEMGRKGAGKKRKLSRDADLLDEMDNWLSLHPDKRQADFYRWKERQLSGEVKADSVRTAINRARKRADIA